MTGNKKVRIGVICDNKEQYNSYVKSHKKGTQCEYIYISEYELPHDIDLHDVIDLRELTRLVHTNVIATRIKELTKYGAFDEKPTDN